MSTGALSILHLAANRWWTGSADPTIQLARAQRARGHHVLLAVPPGDRFEAKAREAGVTLVDGFHLRARLAPLEIAHDADLRICAPAGFFVKCEHPRLTKILPLLNLSYGW